MSDQGERGEASALDAIEAVATEGLTRNRTGRRNRYLVGVLAALFTVGALATYATWKLVYKNKLAKYAVAVLLPDEKSAVADNAERQLQGFKLAFKDVGVPLDDQRLYYFPYPLDKPGENKNKNKMLQQIKNWYEDEGIRIFIMTMSGAVTSIRTDFIAWAQELPDDDKPILLATVASAPEIAESQNGVFRHYIRSRDESAILSTYIDIADPPEIFVIYVKDAYGEKALEILSGRHLIRLADPKFSIPILVTDGQAEIQTKVDTLLMGNSTNREKSVVVIVGYGSMVTNALLALNKGETPSGKFRGEVLVVSTLTEAAWRPKVLEEDNSFARRIRTVGPGKKRDPDERYRGVVFQFAYLTLDRALRCQIDRSWRAKRGLKEFSHCWLEAEPPKSTGKDWAEIEPTADGDSHVSLRLLDHHNW